VEANEDWARSVDPDGAEDFVVFGEWCGKGIQKRTAVSKIPRMFCVFAVQIDEEVHFDPKVLNGWIPEHPDVHVIPWFDADFEWHVELGDKGDVTEFVDVINQMVADVEKCDPFVKDTFGVEGLGEGLVFYPNHYDVPMEISSLMFKAKGEEHKTVRQPKPAMVDFEKLKTSQEFALRYVTPARCEQGLEAIGNELDMKFTGKFLKWMGNDIKSESEMLLDAEGMKWKDVSKEVSRVAKDWWMKKVNG
jgi:hypothetical protein